jgi:hypothetical protein
LRSFFYLALGKALLAEPPKKKRSAKPPALGKEADSGSVTCGLMISSFPQGHKQITTYIINSLLL